MKLETNKGERCQESLFRGAFLQRKRLLAPLLRLVLAPLLRPGIGPAPKRLDQSIPHTGVTVRRDASANEDPILQRTT